MSDNETNADKQGFFNKLSSGDFGLAKTYWVFGVLVGIAIGILSSILGVFAGIGGIVCISLLHTIYVIPVALGTWRASNAYSGNKIWAILAKIAIVLGAISLIANWIMLIAIMSI